MPNVTIAFDETVKGWTSEFTFVPDSGLSLNNNFYTFHNGRVWIHNSENVDRNTFYGLTGDTVIQFVFNQHPTYTKNYKTLGYEGVGDWSAELETNAENGVIQASWFLEKEGKKYSWIRGEDTGFNIDLRSSNVQGIGVATDIATNQITFAPGAVLPPVGATLFRIESSGTPEVVGVVDGKGLNSVSYNLQLGGTANPVQPATGNLIIYTTNSQDKSGIIGFYNIVTMTNTSGEYAEVFSANASTFISSR